MAAPRAGFALPLAAGLALALLGLQLGQWQLRRADEKLDLQRTIDSRASAPAHVLDDSREVLEWQHLRVAGEWLSDQRAFIDNRVYAGRAGYHVVAPLVLEDGRVVLVNRGWVAASADRRELPEVDFEAGRVEISGVVRVPEAHPFQLAADRPDSPIRQHLLPAEFESRLGRKVLPWVIQQTGGQDDGLVRDWPRPDAGIERHRGYAVQWFGLAALAGGLSAYFAIRRVRGGDES